MLSQRKKGGERGDGHGRRASENRPSGSNASYRRYGAQALEFQQHNATALEVYDRLQRLGSVDVDGEPAELWAIDHITTALKPVR